MSSPLSGSVMRIRTRLMNQAECPKRIASTALRYTLYALMMGVMMYAVTMKAVSHPLCHLFDEHSLVETLQVSLLFLTVLSGFCVGCLEPRKQALSILVMGAGAIAFIREFDAGLDVILFDGAWQLLAAAIAVATLVGVRRFARDLTYSLYAFLRTPGFGIMFGGFMVVFVFSRLMGQQVFWKAVMAEGYMRVVKDAVEEGLELSGYALILVGTLECLWETYWGVHHVRKKTDSGEDASAQVPMGS
ncbi:hypothetical protein SAMN05216233_101116 [Desulfoluna spongiiphila]|uniref:Uncharacterized protein n=2 Tax=Desulfoluna spongiiphila TaxID=419481 RepID=A0A1G5AES1_9BACT|nr:hypothetical protein SAMN05216233_101116 [Desulfoluna spongiiphila]